MTVPYSAHSRTVVQHPADVSLCGEGNDELLLLPLSPHGASILHFNRLLSHVALLQQRHPAAARRDIHRHGQLQHHTLIFALHRVRFHIRIHRSDTVFLFVVFVWGLHKRITLTVNDNSRQGGEVRSEQLLNERVVMPFGVDVDRVELGTIAALERVEAVVLPGIVTYRMRR